MKLMYHLKPLEMGKIKIKKCAICGAVDNEKIRVRSYRWMAVMDKYNCNHDLQLKSDLCDIHNKDVLSFLSAQLRSADA